MVEVDHGRGFFTGGGAGDDQRCREDDTMPSRIENILQAIIDSSDPTTLPPPQSRNEALLLQVLDVIERHGGQVSGMSITASERGDELQVWMET